MTAPGSSSGSSTGLSATQKIAATTALVAAASGGLGAAITRSIDSGAVHYGRCADMANVSHIRGLKLHAARLAGDSTFVVPIRLDSTGAPSLDFAHRQLVTDSSLAVLCTVPHDSLAALPPIDSTVLELTVDSSGTPHPATPAPTP